MLYNGYYVNLGGKEENIMMKMEMENNVNPETETPFRGGGYALYTPYTKFSQKN